MKILFLIAVICCTVRTAYGQNDRYYDNSNTDDVYSSDGYNEQEQDNGGQSYQAFYDDLNPYGSWINSPQYGYVWVPLQAGAGFSPYVTNGHWVYTEYGWTWASDFEWGWATFHYGRWYQDPGYGWMWMPGSDWAPAWVVWGEYDNYYCWSPVGPGEYISRHYGGRDHHWNFVEQGHIGDDRLSSYVVNNTVVSHGDTKVNVDDHVKVITHVNSYNRSVFFAGPKSNEVQKAIGHPLERVSVAPAARAGTTRVNGNKIDIYRPDIRRTVERTEAPAHVVARQEDIPRSNSNIAGTSPTQRVAPQRQDNAMPQRQMEPSRSVPATQQWSPPRQSAPRNEMPPAPQRQQAPVDRGGGFVPAGRSSYQAPAQWEFSAPAPMRQNAPAAAPRMGGRR